MQNKFKAFVFRWINTMAGVILASYLIKPGIHVDNFGYLALAALVLGLLNAYIRPILMGLSLILMLLTLGLFTLVINAGLLYLAGWLLKPGFRVDTFSDAFWGAIVIAITGLILNVLTGTGSLLVKIGRGNPPHGPRPGGDGNGPFIDV